MPADVWHRLNGQPRIDTSWLYPPFLVRLRIALARSQERGADYYPTCGWRSFEEQAKRHAAYKAGTGTRAAPEGLSPHQYGAAADLAPDGDLKKPGLQADYRLKNYAILVEEVRRVGLVSGVSFNDAPHVQIPRFVAGRDLRRLRTVYRSAKGTTERERLDAVWAYLDSLPLFPSQVA